MIEQNETNVILPLIVVVIFILWDMLAVKQEHTKLHSHGRNAKREQKK